MNYMNTGVCKDDVKSSPSNKAFRDGFDAIDWSKGKKKEDIVYSSDNCLFAYCPHPEICKKYGENHCLNPRKK